MTVNIINLSSNNIISKSFAIQLRDDWIAKDIISMDETYEEVNGNKDLMFALKCRLISILPDTVLDSQFGKQFGISDFDLYRNCSTDNAILQTLIRYKISTFALEDYAKLKRSHSNLTGLMRRILKKTLINMDLFGTPSKKADKLITQEYLYRI